MAPGSVTAVILCGPGHELEPLTATPGTPKALLPVANRALVENVLRWVEDAGLTGACKLWQASER